MSTTNVTAIFTFEGNVPWQRSQGAVTEVREEL